MSRPSKALVKRLYDAWQELYGLLDTSDGVDFTLEEIVSYRSRYIPYTPEERIELRKDGKPLSAGYVKQWEEYRYDVFRSESYHGIRGACEFTGVRVSAKTMLSYIEEAISSIENDWNLDHLTDTKLRDKFVLKMANSSKKSFRKVSNEYSLAYSALANRNYTEAKPYKSKSKADVLEEINEAQKQAEKLLESFAERDGIRRALWSHQAGTHSWTLSKGRVAYPSFLPREYDKETRQFKGRHGGVYVVQTGNSLDSRFVHNNQRTSLLYVTKAGQVLTEDSKSTKI